ncbi:MAG TPA: M14 family zinc carboxypeptidase [Candidatus Eisenbacteria bacterium]|nr:M14 family zinc carboxypeptidase [Candidatus Eisenbacteria bacterium]
MTLPRPAPAPRPACRAGAAFALALALGPAPGAGAVVPASAIAWRNAAIAVSEPQLVRVRLTAALTLDRVLAAGLDVVGVRGGAWADVLEWPGDAAKLAALGAATEVLDPDPARSAAARAARELAARPRAMPARVISATAPDGAFRAQSLPPFGSGSMGGYWTLDEVKMELDSLVAADTHDIVADQLDTLGYTLQGRPIWGLALGRRVTGPDPRPVVFYSALTHAREPEGMQALLYFVHDILSKYGSDPFATSLLDTRRLYIVPVVNPDGYELNRITHPAGGGFHRKNVRDVNGNGIVDYGFDGVDINRNFSFMWGLDDIGSEPDSSTEDYRGPAPVSEPETQAQRDVVVRLQPRTGLAYHTYSDLFLHPWGYQAAAAPDSQAFYEWNDAATIGSGYSSGNSSRVLYRVNGEFNDWVYGDTLAKPRGFTWTPEIGTADDGFWPAPSRIVPLAEDNLRKAWFVAAIAGPYPRVERSAIVEGALDAGFRAHLSVRARNLGLAATPAPLTATLSPLDAGVFVDTATVSYPAMASRTSADAIGGATFAVSCSDTVTPGRLVRFALEFSGAGECFARDTVEVLLGTPTTLRIEPFNTLGAWSASGGYGIVQNDPRHPSRYASDSPAGIYPTNMSAALIASAPLDLSHGVHAWALLDDRFNLEQFYDGAVFEASPDSVTWTPLPARASAVGTQSGNSIPNGVPEWTGGRWLWSADRVDLSPFAGPGRTKIRIRLRSRSDSGLDLDGMNLDSLRVLVFDPAVQPVPTAVPGAPPAARLAFDRPSPNPARGLARLAFDLPRAARVALDVLDVQGRRVRTLAAAPYAAGRYALAWDLADDLGRPVAPGVYLARLAAGAQAITRPIVVLR